MPAKDCLSLSFRQQADIERAKLSGCGRLRYSIDIIKSFNQLAWPIIWDPMSRLGIPDSLLRFWLSGLQNVERRPCFAGSLAGRVRASNGAPEGDPLSVAAMCAVCFASHAVMAPSEVQFDTFVDNWLSVACQPLFLSPDRGWLPSSCPPTGTSCMHGARPGPCESGGRRRHLCCLRARGRCKSSLVCGSWDVCTPFKGDCQPSHMTNAWMTAFSVSSAFSSNHGRLCKRWPACLHGLESFPPPQVGPAARVSPFLALGAITDRVADSQAYCLQRQLQALRRRDRSCIHLFETTKHEVGRFVAITWAYHVRDQVSHRCGLHDIPPPLAHADPPTCA